LKKKISFWCWNSKSSRCITKYRIIGFADIEWFF
jgi:hypothetical protein